MQIIKTGKEEITYLLAKAIEKYKLETGQEIIQNTNRKNYESLAIMLSDISNQLPFRFEEFGTEIYSPDNNQKLPGYPHRKYDITGGQIKDALSGIVTSPRPFLVDACYIYLYGMGRKAFKQNPVDASLLHVLEQDKKEEKQQIEMENDGIEKQLSALQTQYGKKNKILKIVSIITVFACIALLAVFLNYRSARNEWQSLKENMNILPYQPTQMEIDSLEGVWLCYIGSPQARISNSSRYHQIVTNLVDVKYKDGYFTFNRYGASFNHIGYMQFESPGIVTVYSRIKTTSGKTESPRHSLLSLNTNTQFLAAISASWNFDVGENNKIIGIREIYTKLGKGGTVEEVINEIENASCQCKMIRWHQEDKNVKTFYLKNQLLDSIPYDEIKPLINENSILLNMPQDGLLIKKDSI